MKRLTVLLIFLVLLFGCTQPQQKAEKPSADIAPKEIVKAAEIPLQQASLGSGEEKITEADFIEPVDDSTEVESLLAELR